jgi:hypothetical protein
MNKKPTHTPGPWRVSKESSTIIENGHGLILGSACGCDDSGYFPSDQTAVANAVLMAAAPSLLAALEEAEKELCKQEDMLRSLDRDDGSCEIAILTARQAIEKAKKAQP